VNRRWTPMDAGRKGRIGSERVGGFGEGDRSVCGGVGDDFRGGAAGREQAEEVGVENLHEMGYSARQRRNRAVRLGVEIVGLVVLGGGLLLAGARIDGLERELALAENGGQSLGALASDSARYSPHFRDTAWYGVRSVTELPAEQGGGWVVRISPVPEAERVKSSKVEGKGK